MCLQIHMHGACFCLALRHKHVMCDQHAWMGLWTSYQASPETQQEGVPEWC
jgi:hypothetical protein